MRKKVLIATVVHHILIQFLEEQGYECITDLKVDYEEVIKKASLFEGIITSNKLPVDKELIKAASQLKWVGRMGSGMEIIDVPYAQSKGIRCFSSPEGNANAVAEQALGMLLALQHRIFSSAREVSGGIWRRDENRGIEIAGLSAGIIGYGNNGSAFARKLMAMDVNVYAYDKYSAITPEKQLTVCDDLGNLYEQCDIISFHVPLNIETHHYFNYSFLTAMKKTFTLLNLSRGEVVDTAALFQGLKSGKIVGAAVDVWEKEPLSHMEGAMKQMVDEMLQMDNFIGTPHIGGYSIQAIYRMSYFLMEKIRVSQCSS